MKKDLRFLEKIAEGLRAWTKLGLLWLLLTFVLRLCFFFVLAFSNKIERSSFFTVLSGVYFDIALVLFVGAITLVPFLIINWLLPKTTYFISIVFITLYVIVYGCLIGYYSNVMQPLDRVFFVYSVQHHRLVSEILFLASGWRVCDCIFVLSAAPFLEPESEDRRMDDAFLFCRRYSFCSYF